LVLVSVAVLSALLLAEAALRVYGFGRAIRYQPHTQLGWTMLPNQSAFNVRGRAKVRTNSLGFRGPELQERGRAWRILVLGDGVVLGNQTQEAETFPFLCQADLQARLGRPVEVVVGAVSGYQLEQLHELLRLHVDALRPDVVVVGFCWNDWTLNTMRGPGLGPRGSSETDGPRHVGERTALYDFGTRLRRLWRRRAQEEGFRQGAGLGAPQHETAAWTHVQAMLDSLHATATRAGTRLVLLVLPARLVDFDPERYAPRAAKLSDWAAAHAVTFVSPQEHIDPAQATGLYWDSLHLNAAGHRVVAPALVEALHASADTAAP
jgi:lysophospholipase L1-like esterase